MIVQIGKNQWIPKSFPNNCYLICKPFKIKNTFIGIRKEIMKP